MKMLIATNHSYMFYRFRKELVEALMQEHEVILSTDVYKRQFLYSVYGWVPTGT